MKRLFTLTFSYLLLTHLAFSQKARWTAGSLEQKVFIENKGQFDGKNNLGSSSIRYAFTGEGIEIYFTAHGLTYRHDEIQPVSREEREETERDRRQAEPMPVSTPHYVQMNWEGANPAAEIIPEEGVSFYYTYPDVRDALGKSCYKASAFRKITYKNLYPNIDVEYFFPANRPGIEYSLILHPGADASIIKMNYSGEQKESLDGDGNIQIITPFGNIVDHAPHTFYQDARDAVISSYFILKENSVAFNLQSYDQSRTVIIDPWTTNPNFPSYNAAYDVEFDSYGNVYVYGGGIPWKEMKYDSTGTLLWTYTAGIFTVAGYYGDFCVDASSGSSYIFEAYRCCGLGTRIAKVNSAGVQVTMFNGDARIQEFWRATFNNCTKKLIASGSSFVSPTYFQSCIVDTDLTGITPVNVLNVNSLSGSNDLCLLTMDNSNNCFMGSCGNKFLKCPANTLTPAAYLLPDNHPFTELTSIAYINNYVPSAIGMNGMAASNNYLYSYDGKLIQRWRKSNGAFMNGAVISSTAFRWGGIAVDDCDHIFVGNESSVFQYDTSFNVVATIPMPSNTDTVYDVRLGKGNTLYVCGLGFLSSIELNNTICNSVALSITSSGSCSSAGSASISATGGTAPYIYFWSGGQTTSSITGLSSGTYTVTVTDASCIQKIQTAMVVVAIGGGLTITTSQNDPLCSSSANGSATVTVAGGQLPYSYSWSPSGGTDASATGLSAGTYTVSITDAGGCSARQTFTLTSPPPLVLDFKRVYNICAEGSGTVQLTASGGTTYSWSPSTGLDNPNIPNPMATVFANTTYTVTVTNGTCSDTAHVTINLVPVPVFPPISQIGDSMFVPQGYSNYQWFYEGSPIGGATNFYYNATQSGHYSVFLTDTNGCKGLTPSLNMVIISVPLSPEIKEDRLKIYPNPATGSFIILLPQQRKEGGQLTISDMLGREVFLLKVSDEKQITIDASSFARGVYFIQFVLEDKSLRAKVAKN